MDIEEYAQSVVETGLNHEPHKVCIQKKSLNPMIENIENLAQNFLELSSEQRLSILLKLNEKKSKVSILAKELDATDPEVFRNFQRLVKSNMVEKDPDGYYHLTTYSKTIIDQFSSFVFISKNYSYFKNHDFGNLPSKFIKRIGELYEGKHIKGFVKVLEKWKQIHDNADEYIYNILSEVPYSKDIIDIVENKLKNKIKIFSIFAQNTIIPDERKTVFKIKEFDKYIKDGLLERKMVQNVSIVCLLNEKEACIIFPKLNGEPDLSEMFFSMDSQFHEWCLDYFKFYQENSTSFQESKLK